MVSWPKDLVRNLINTYEVYLRQVFGIFRDQLYILPKMIVSSDVELQSVAATILHVFILSCVAIVVVVVRNSECFKISGVAIEASALYTQMASMQINGSAIHSYEQDNSK